MPIFYADYAKSQIGLVRRHYYGTNVNLFRSIFSMSYTLCSAHAAHRDPSPFWHFLHAKWFASALQRIESDIVAADAHAARARIYLRGVRVSLPTYFGRTGLTVLHVLCARYSFRAVPFPTRHHHFRLFVASLCMCCRYDRAQFRGERNRAKQWLDRISARVCVCM